jgi:outer membrane protein assembly factor BamB
MRRVAIFVTLPLAVLASCTSGSVGATQNPARGPGAPAVSGGAAWPTYHGSPQRSGTAHPINPPLHEDWRTGLDGSVYGEALYVQGHVIAATENDSVYALNPSTGHVEWRTHLGQPQNQDELPCGDINPLGITGTPAYDPGTGSVFVVAETEGGHHTLWALNAKTGHRRWHRNMDVLPRRDRHAEQQRAALLVAHGRVYTAYGGLAGDCANYIGYVTSTAVSGKGKTYHYAVPSAREAGMWATPGPVEGANGDIYVAAGNGAELNGRWDKSDSVTELSPKKLRRVGVFAPSVWRADNRHDADLGSSSPIPVPAAKRMVISGKNGHVYLLKPNHLGGVGGDVKSLSGCSAFGGGAVHGHTVVMPCIDGVRALSVHKHGLHWRWTASDVYGSPIIAGKKVYVAERNTGTLRVLRLRGGHQVASFLAGGLTHFPSATLVGKQIFIATLTGVTALHGS